MTDYICSFVLHKRSKEDSLAHLQCRILWDSCRRAISVSLGYLIDPMKWDMDAQRCRPKSRHGRNGISGQAINNEIVRFERAVSDVFARFDTAPSADKLREAVRDELDLETRRSLTVDNAFSEFCLDVGRKHSWSDATFEKMHATKGHIDSFGGFRNFGCFNETHLQNYVRHLTDEGLTNPTIENHLAYLHMFLKWAEGRGYLTDRSYAFFKPKLKMAQRPVIFLTWDELMRVWNWEAECPYLGEIRDIFCFCCFTSLRYSDAIALRWADIGPESFRVVTKKTTDFLTIDLNAWSEEILKRYVDNTYPGGTVFPHICNQVMNRELKRIMKACGVDAPVALTVFHGSERTDKVYKKWELVGTHAGRRTFICNALMMGIPPTTVMQWTGHSDYQAMKPYIAVADAERAKSMRLFDKRRDTKV